MKFNLLATASTLALSSLFELGAPHDAQATLTCNSVSDFCTETVDLGSAQTNFSVAATLDDFNLGAGYNLTSVVLSGGGTLSSNGTIKNTGSSPATFSYSGGMKLSISGGTGAPPGFPPLVTNTNVPSTVFRNIGSGASVSYTAAGPLTGTSKTLTTSLSPYVGTGTFQAVVSGVAHNTLSTDQSNIVAAVATSGDPFVEITYNYAAAPPPTPISEPACLAVLGAGLTGIGVLRRRRRT